MSDIYSNADLLFRQAPHSVEVEQAVLGSMLIDADCVKDVMAKLKPDDFYMAQNRDIFQTIYEMSLNCLPIDGLTVAAEMEKRNLSDDVTRTYLAQLMEITPTSANVMEYVKIVLDKALTRSLSEAGADIVHMTQEGGVSANELLDVAEQRIYAIRNGRNVSGMRQIKETLPPLLDKLGELSERGGKIPGLSTGLSALDNKIMGLNAPDLVIVAARPGMGKTSMAVEIALNVARSAEQAVAIFSLEMSEEQITAKILSMEGLVENRKMKTGNLDESDWEKIAEAVVTLSRMKIFIDENPMITVAEISAKCRRIENLGLVVIDYLQLMNGVRNRNENRQQAVSDMSRMLKIMAKELNVPVICLSQLSRANEKRDDKRPQLSDLRESGAIEQDADIVMFLYRDGYYHEDAENPDIAECIVAKNRHGETGKIELRWVPEYTMFATIEDREG